MRRLSALSVVMLIVLLSVFCANSLDTKLYSQKLSTDNNRLFDVSVCVKSGSVLSAGTLSLSYDNSAVAFRRAYSDNGYVKVRSVDSGNRVKVIFLCKNGIKVSKKSELFKVRFKAVSPGNTDIKISASDFVNGNARSISPPASVKCSVSVSEKSAVGKAVRRRNVSGSYYKKRYSTKSENAYSSRSGSAVSSGGDDDDDSVFSAISNKEKTNPLLMVILSTVAAVSVAVMAIVITRNENSKK